MAGDVVWRSKEAEGRSENGRAVSIFIQWPAYISDLLKTLHWDRNFAVQGPPKVVLVINVLEKKKRGGVGGWGVETDEKKTALKG